MPHAKKSMIRLFLSCVSLGMLSVILGALHLNAQPIQVKIVGPDSAYTTHDLTTIAADLDAMLKGASGFTGSAASATVFTGQSLIEAFYHPSYRTATRSTLDSKHDFLVIVPEFTFLSSFPEAAFEGVLQMSRRALNAGSTPLLLMPRGGSIPLSTAGENSYRMGNGSGVEVVPGGYAVESVPGLSSPSTTGKFKAAGVSAGSVAFFRNHRTKRCDKHFLCACRRCRLGP